MYRQLGCPKANTRHCTLDLPSPAQQFHPYQRPYKSAYLFSSLPFTLTHSGMLACVSETKKTETQIQRSGVGPTVGNTFGARELLAARVRNHVPLVRPGPHTSHNQPLIRYCNELTAPLAQCHVRFRRSGFHHY